MSLAQEDMVPGPDAVIVRLSGVVIVAMMVIMPVVVVMAVIMVMRMTVIVQGVPVMGMIVRHDQHFSVLPA
jgi:hypothetical protein